MLYKTIDEWVKHFLERFAKEELEFWITSFKLDNGSDCPCESIERKCGDCQHYNGDWYCEEGQEWFNYVSDEEIKEIIKKIERKLINS